MPSCSNRCVMSEEIWREVIFMGQFLALGVAITFLYDILRILRRVIRHGNLLLSFEDLLFWTGCAVSIFYLLYRENNGTLRWFAILGAMVGMLIYKATISRCFVRYTVLGLLKVKKLFAPLRKTGRFFKKKLTAFLKVFRMILCKR